MVQQWAAAEAEALGAVGPDVGPDGRLNKKRSLMTQVHSFARRGVELQNVAKTFRPIGWVYFF